MSFPHYKNVEKSQIWYILTHPIAHSKASKHLREYLKNDRYFKVWMHDGEVSKIEEKASASWKIMCRVWPKEEKDANPYL